MVASAYNECSLKLHVCSPYLQGIKKTAKSNFGGGNTDWEEKNLGTYAFSETRFIEITEGICRDSDKDVRHSKIRGNFSEKVGILLQN